MELGAPRLDYPFEHSSHGFGGAKYLEFVWGMFALNIKSFYSSSSDEIECPSWSDEGKATVWGVH